MFIAENPDGTISLDFIFDASALAGKETVVFENVYRDGRLVASHTDIHDEGQTVRIVNLRFIQKLQDKMAKNNCKLYLTKSGRVGTIKRFDCWANV